MTLPERLTERRGARTGSALLIVLGLLSLLMIAGVAFTILMRIERSSASNLRHTSAARHLAKGGLAYAIAALNAEIGGDLCPNWTNRFYTPAGHDPNFPKHRPKLRMPEDVFLSVDENEKFASEVARARVLTAEAARYLPGALRHRAEMTGDAAGNTYASPEWIPVRAKGGDDKQDEIIGRYAYVILNTTGLLDANSVHTNPPGKTARWLGADAGELQLHPSVQMDIANLDDFLNEREEDGRYETLAELSTLNSGVKGEEYFRQNKPPASVDNAHLDAIANFDVFSYSLPDLMPLDPPPGASVAMGLAHSNLVNTLGGNCAKRIPAQKIDISSVNKNDAGQRGHIMLALQAAGLKDNDKFNASQAKWAYLGLLDYIDDDNEPAYVDDWTKLPGQQKISKEEQMFARPATEAMPLFSIFHLMTKYEATDFKKEEEDWTVHTVTYDFFVVYTYPFQAPRGPFKLDAEILVMTPGGTPDPWEPLLPPMDDTYKVSAVVTPEPGIDLEPLHVRKTSTLELPKSAGKPTFLRFVTGCRARTLYDGKVIRQTPYEYDHLNSMVQLDIGMTGDDIKNNATFWNEAIDPRCNWNGMYALWRANRDYAPWEENPGSCTLTNEAPLVELKHMIGYPVPSKPNSYPLHYYMLTTPSVILNYFKIYTDGMRIDINDTTQAHCDPIMPQLRAHVANRPLQSVGELGYLPIGLWLTINLYDHGHVPPDGFSNTDYGNNVLPPGGYHPVLDYFTLGDPGKGRHGLVNLNTPNPEVIGALFTGLPVQPELYTHTPASPGPTILAKGGGACDDALDLAEWLIDKGPFERLSDLGGFFRGTPQLGVASGDYADAYPLAALTKAVGGAVSEFEREALIRNICNLVTLRGQTFTIILRADAFSPRFGLTGVKYGNVLATATAVAQVWRDTEPVAGTKNHPTFIQFFKIINE